jgi:hypothetical protein
MERVSEITKPMLTILILAMLLIGSCSCNAQAGEEAYQVVRQTYADRAISISYPELSGMSDEEKQQRLNQLIRSEALSILADYEEGELDKLTVKLDYVIGRQTPGLFSVRFNGSRFLKGTAYPTDLMQSVNLDVRTGRKLRLPDVIRLDEQFVEAIKNGRMNAVEGVTWKKLKLDDKRLLKAFFQADSAVSSENPAWVFSYFTKDGMGISFSVIHALGDHVQLELSMDELKSFIQPEIAELVTRED